MNFRVTNAPTSNHLADWVQISQQRASMAEQQLATGKRITHPSDDPAGAGAVIQINNSQAIIQQFISNANDANTRLTTADTALNSYQQILDRASSLLTQGASTTTTAEARQSLADEIDGLRQQVLNIANTRTDSGYVFGGTRQNAPPYDPTTGAPAGGTPGPSLMQVEPGASPVTVGVTAESTFADANGTVLDTLTQVASALRGTGNPTADQTTILNSLDRLTSFTQQAAEVRSQVGSSLNLVSAATDTLNSTSLSLQTSLQQVSGADAAQAATDLTSAQNALQAISQAGTLVSKDSLISLLG